MNQRPWFRYSERLLLMAVLAATLPWPSKASIKTLEKEADAYPPNAIVIEALIDGQSELRVTKNSIYWIHTGGSAKPGRHGKVKEPTYINGQPWTPVWNKNAEDRGDDQCSPYALTQTVKPDKLNFKLLAVTQARAMEGVDVRDPIKIVMVGDELSITIPDRQIGSRWYKFVLTPEK